MTGMFDRPGQSRLQWLVILAGVCAAMHLGKLSPALPVLRDALGLSLLQSGFLLSLVQLAGMLLGLAAGATADGMGFKRSMVAGLLLLSLASAGGGWARDVADLLVSRALEGLGFLLVVLPAPGLIRRLVEPARAKLTLGYWGAYMPLGTAAALLVGPLLLDALGWRGWWWVLAGLSFVMALCLVLWVPADRAVSRRVGVDALRPNASSGVSDSWAARVRRTVLSRGPCLAALSFAVYSGQWLAVIGFLPSMVAASGSFGVATAPLLALAALVNMVGNIVSGRMLQRGVPAHFLLYTGFCAMGAGALLAFAAVPGTDAVGSLSGLRYAGVVMFSLMGGLVPGTLFSLAVVLAPDEASVSTTVGWMQQWSATGQFFGPPVVAWVASFAGDWRWTWVVTCTCSLCGLALARQIAKQVAR